MKNIIAFLTLFFATNFIMAQTIPIFHWQDHLCYKNGRSVAAGGGKVICATKSGIFSFSTGDNSMEKLSKINSLSDVEATVVRYNNFNNKFIIAYKNSNLDIVRGTTIINIPDIKNKNIIGNKYINDIYFKNQFAYMACGFGIVVVDMNRIEIADTWYIGPGGNSINVRDVTSDSTYFYAATDVGIFRAPSSSNLANYSSWSPMMNGLSTGIYNSITSFEGNLYTNLSKELMSTTAVPTHYQDQLYKFDYVNNDTMWRKLHPFENSGYILETISTEGNTILFAFNFSGIPFINDLAGDSLVNIGYYSNPYFTGVEDGVIDNNGDAWFADDNNGLVSWRHGIGFESRYPNGPASAASNCMSLVGNSLMVAPGGLDVSYFGLLNHDGLSSYQNQSWSTIKSSLTLVDMDSVLDVVSVAIDPQNENHCFASSWGNGLLELNDGIPTQYYRSSNSTLQNNSSGGGVTYLNGLAFDANNNLWVANAKTPKRLSRRTPEGIWTSIDFTSAGWQQDFPDLGQMIIDKNDQKWVIIHNGGILVYKGNTTATATASTAKILSSSTGNGALPSVNIYALAEDANGEIWVGSDKGISVFYSPENLFVTGQNFDSQQILIEQDGQAQILLLTELVQAIAVDDANRKWIGTANSGVFLMSADGTQQIYHFDASNSPLFSNNVNSIAVNHQTGEVYFGTAEGIIEFRGSAVAASSDCGDVYAFPNPVKPNYDGPIAIKGLMDNSTCKITDVTGKLVYEMKSDGGQALWYGKNFKGQRVSTGVYFVFCTSEDASCKTTTKILFIN